VTEHGHDSRCVGIEIRGLYDGVAIWDCSDGEVRNRFREATGLPWPQRLIDKAETYREAMLARKGAV